MIRIGIVGCGRILNAHLQGYKALRDVGIDDFQITALAARREEDAAMFITRGDGPPPRPAVLPPESGDPLATPHTYLSDFQEDVPVQVYTDYRRMIAEAPIDAVNDFTSVALHHQVGAVALQHGKHLLTQKPFTVSVKAGQRLVELAASKRVSLGVFECVRQQLLTRAIGWAVKEGLIGQPHFALIGSLGGFWSPDRVVADTPWRHRKLAAGGGGTIDIGVHAFHLLRYVLGEVEWVNAVTRTFEPIRYRRGPSGDIVETVRVDVDDTYLAVAGFAGDAVAQMLWSWGGHGEPLEMPGVPAFYGSEGCIRGAELVYDDGSREDLLGRFEAELTADRRDRFFPLRLTDPFALQQLDWLRSIQAAKDPETSGREGLRDLACAFALLESSALGRRVTLDEVLTGTVAAYQEDIDVHYGLD